MKLARSLLTFCLLGIPLIVSLVFYIEQERATTRYIFFYPNRFDADFRLNGEEYVVPDSGDTQQNIQRFLEKLMLPPISIELASLFPPALKINAVILRDDRLYVDLSSRIITPYPSSSESISFARRLDAIESNLHYNFRSLDRVIVTVNGQIPYTRRFVI